MNVEYVPKHGGFGFQYEIPNFLFSEELRKHQLSEQTYLREELRLIDYGCVLASKVDRFKLKWQLPNDIPVNVIVDVLKDIEANQ